MENQIVNIIGLFFGVIGIVILYNNALPPNMDKKGQVYLFNEGDPFLAKRVAKQLRNNRVGLGFIILGFMLQLASPFPKPASYESNCQASYHCCHCICCD